MNGKKDATSPIKNTLEFINEHKKLTIAAVAVVLLGWVLFVPHGKSNDQYESAKLKYEEVDVAGLTVKQACDELREKGWKISDEVIGENDDYESVDSSNCDDTTHKSKRVDYTADDFNAKYNDIAILYFTSNKKSASDDTTSSDTKKSDTSSKKELVTGGNGTDADVIAKVEANALSGGLCRFKQAPEQVVSVDQVGTSATTEFINMGIKLFKGDTCRQFTYQLAILTDDGRGNQSRNTVLQFNVKKSKFQSYNWQNLEGRVVGTQLQNDGIITMVNTSIGLDPSKFELYALQ